jgi:Na+-transporting methylmalonyl-CoA/oxaloacetate decarboxylase beta subunit
MSWDQVWELIISILTTQSGMPNLMFKQIIMMAVAFFFLYLAVAKNYEPLLLVPIGFRS